MGVEVKICGLTRPEDAELAATHGASRLGVIFAGGPRLIDIRRAADIVTAAAGVPVFGVFGSQSITTMLDIMHRAGLSGAQLHQPADAGTADRLRAAGFAVWRVASLRGADGLGRQLATAAHGVDGVVIEPFSVDGSGGKGVALDWQLARAARELLPRATLVLAGGLTPDNVGDAIRVVRPDVVDVSSGVESAPGIKDRGRLTRFLEYALGARPAV